MDDTRSDTATVSWGSSRNHGRIKDQIRWCFLSITLVAFVVGIFLTTALVDGSYGIDGGPEGTGISIGTPLRWGIAAGIGVIVGAVGLAFLILNRNIADPLAKTAAVAERMADGHLAASLPTTAPNEIGRIGEHMNGLAVNFQEVLVLVWNQTESALAKLRRITKPPPTDRHPCLPPDLLEGLLSARQDLETMQTMVRSFDLYDVAITPEDVVTSKGTPEGVH